MFHDPEGGGGGEGLDLPGKSLVAICFLRISGTDQLLLEGGPYSPL